MRAYDPIENPFDSLNDVPSLALLCRKLSSWEL
jgi:hypothetical protein